MIEHNGPDGFTPKAFANSSPGLFQPWLERSKHGMNAEGVGELFQSCAFSSPTIPALKQQPWAQIRERPLAYQSGLNLHT